MVDASAKATELREGSSLFVLLKRGIEGSRLQACSRILQVLLERAKVP